MCERLSKGKNTDMSENDLPDQQTSSDDLFAERVQEILAAAGKGDAVRVQALLTLDERLANAKGVWDKTPLHEAAERDHQEIAHILLAAGANLEQRTTWGMTPLEWAGNMGSRKVADELLKHGAQLNLWTAAGLGFFDVVRSYWLKDGTLEPGCGQIRNRQDEAGRWVSVPAPTNPIEIVSDAFHIAARNGHVPIAEFLLGKGARIDQRGFFGASGLLWAAINGHRAMVEFLVTQGADIHFRDLQFKTDAVCWAKEGKHLDIVEYLWGKGGRLTLSQAAGLGRLDWLKIILDADPALLNKVDHFGAPLHEAALHGQTPVVEHLLALGADPNLKDSEGDTALTVVLKAMKGLIRPGPVEQHPAILEILRRHGGQE